MAPFSRRTFSTGRIASVPSGTGAPVMMRTASPFFSGAGGAVAGPDEAGALGHRPLAGGEVGQDHGVAVHRGRVEGRPGDVGSHVAREHPAGGLAQRDHLRRSRGAGAAEDLEGFGDLDHGPILRLSGVLLRFARRL